MVAGKNDAFRFILYMLHDAPGGLFVVLDEAPLVGQPACQSIEHVLLVGVQHVTGMWVLRGMRMKAKKSLFNERSVARVREAPTRTGNIADWEGGNGYKSLRDIVDYRHRGFL